MSWQKRERRSRSRNPAKRASFVGDGYCFRCKKCRHRVSIRTVTFLELFHCSLKSFVVFVYGWVANWSNAQLIEQPGLSHSTIGDYNNFMRDVARFVVQVVQELWSSR